MPRSKFIKGDNVNCLSCGSTMLREELNQETGTIDKSCFCCGAGEIALKKLELAGLDYMGVLEICGREPGFAADILPRLNTPGRTVSFVQTSRHVIEMVRAAYKIKDEMPN